jgi:gas vesicle protein
MTSDGVAAGAAVVGVIVAGVIGFYAAKSGMETRILQLEGNVLQLEETIENLRSQTDGIQNINDQVATFSQRISAQEQASRYVFTSKELSCPQGWTDLGEGGFMLEWPQSENVPGTRRGGKASSLHEWIHPRVCMKQ